MRKLIILFLLLTVPAFAQDDELPRPRRLTEEEQRQSVKRPNAARTPNLPGCLTPGSTTYGRCKTSEQYKREQSQGQTEETIPMSGRRGREIDGDGIAILAGVGVLALVAAWITKSLRGGWGE